MTSGSWRKDAGIKHVPLTIGESPDGPPDYEVAKDADITVLMWNRHKVKVNHAYKGELTDKDVQCHRGRHSQSPERLSHRPSVRGVNDYHHRPDRPSSATRARCPGRVISGEKLIIREPGSGSRCALEKGLDRAGTSLAALNVTLELGSNAAIKDAVRRGLGVAFLSHLTVRRELGSQELQTVAVKGLEPRAAFLPRLAPPPSAVSRRGCVPPLPRNASH